MAQDNVYRMPETLLDWYLKQLADSGITSEMADHAGISVHTSDPLGLCIQYYDRNGDSVPDYVRVRVRDTDVKFESTYEERQRKFSKYTQKKGLGQRLYWPRVKNVRHDLLGSDISTPLFVVEGEKKAIRVQAELGITASAIGIPGVLLGKSILQELSNLPLLDRTVYLVFDWNNPDIEAEAETRKAESRLAAYLSNIGAKVFVLRWQNPTKTEQKVDDWLQSGGNFTEALEYSKTVTIDQKSELVEILQEFNNLYGVYAGKIIMLNNPHIELSSSQFHVHTADKYLWDETGKKPKKVQVSDLWLSWNNRTMLEGRIFLPPPIGEPVVKIVDRHVNISPPWPKIEGDPLGDNKDYSLFISLLRRFSESENHFRWLSQHIAHAARYPTQGTSNGVVFADEGGTGKGLLFRTLRKLFGHLVVEIKDELTGRFNDRLAGKLIGLYDEPDYDRTENVNIDKNTKRIVGNQYLSVEGKGLRTYTVENYLRLFVSMNLKFLGRINRTDRRWNYFTSASRMSPHEANEYARWLDAPESAVALRNWVHDVDLEYFNPNVLGPISRGRQDAIGFAAGIFDEFLDWDRLAEREVWSNADLYIMFTNFAPSYRKVNPVSLGKQLNAMLGDHSSRTVKVNGAPVRLRAVRNVGDWMARDSIHWAEESLRGR